MKAGELCYSMCSQEGDCPLSNYGMSLFGCPTGDEGGNEQKSREDCIEAIRKGDYDDALRYINDAKYWQKKSEFKEAASNAGKVIHS